MPHRHLQPSQAEIRLMQAFPTLNTQAAMQREGSGSATTTGSRKLSKDLSASTSSSSMTGTTSLHKQKSSESFSFFARWNTASRRGSSATTSQKSAGDLDWACRGEDMSPGEGSSPSEDPADLRPPSLTHSRASSSDSTVSSVDDKPLPALPPNAGRLTPDSKEDLFSVQIPSGILSVVPSRSASYQDGPINQIYIPDLDYCGANSIAARAPSPSVASTLTPRRPQSTFSYLTASSPRTISWTPRPSASSFCASDEDAFELEALLAAQDELHASNPSPSSFPRRPSREAAQPIALTEEIGTPQNTSVEETNEAEEQPSADVDEAQERQNEIDVLIQAATPSPRNEAPAHCPVSAPASPMQDFVLPIDEEEEEGEGDSESSPESTTRPVPVQQSRRQHIPGKLSLGGGWRGWRVGSQPTTPAEEIPPHLRLRISVQSPSGLTPAGPLLSPRSQQHPAEATSEVDYFGAALGQQLRSIPEASSDRNSLVVVGDRSESSPSASPLPKLSPEFSFGRRTPTPTPQDRVRASLEFVRRISTSSPNFSAVPLPARRLRAASADNLNLQMRQHASAASKGAITRRPFNSTAAEAQAQRTLHRQKLSQRRRDGSAGPKMQAHSLDGDALKQLRDRATGTPRYEWI